VRPETEADDPERLAIRESLAFGKALYDRRTALGLSVLLVPGVGGSWPHDWNRPAVWCVT
jgi:hypothetical protein